MMKKTVKLVEPLEVGGQIITEVEVRPSTVGDEEDAMQTAIKLGKTHNQLSVEICLIARVTNLSYDKIRSMCGIDYSALRAALNELNGKISEEEDFENLMTPDAN